MLRNEKKSRAPEPNKSRTDRDRIMVFLGLLIIVVFLVAAYLAITESDRAPARKIRGPMKYPRTSGLWEAGKDLVKDKHDWMRSVCS